MKQSDYDVVVVGGGHAGVEAAHAAGRMGATTALVTLDVTKTGVMSCNPAVGGLGKGHLVREIDALDGVMGRAADHAGIQFRLLNRRKGPAVQGPRTQADRKRFQHFVQNVMAESPVVLLEGEVADLLVHDGRVRGVVLADGSEIAARSVVLTTGTFLGGVIHIGTEKSVGGRIGEGSVIPLADRLAEMGVVTGRLKTGTPPRLRSSSIDWAALDMQPGDPEPTFLSFLSTEPQCRQIACGITHTTVETHDIIRANLERSAMYSGAFTGVGPRYCPSIEDKVVRFADKESHQVFVEPEGLDSDLVYPNGISTSLPLDVQEAYVRSISGFERAEIVQPGYAIEYSYSDPRSLDRGLQLKSLSGLFLAGQINGTTGYEEAGAQGVVAGINAVRSARGLDHADFNRGNSYIGVMIDDLVRNGVTEPYRMFTSRAEYRLTLRADNADQRLTPMGIELGCVEEERRQAWSDKGDKLSRGRAAFEQSTITSAILAEAGARLGADKPPRTGWAALALEGVEGTDIAALVPGFPDLPAEVLAQLKRDGLYDIYAHRQAAEFAELNRLGRTRIPEDVDLGAVDGLSNELSEKVRRLRPRSLADLKQIEGMTPSAEILLLAAIKRHALAS